jgi:hypothetical protein
MRGTQLSICPVWRSDVRSWSIDVGFGHGIPDPWLGLVAPSQLHLAAYQQTHRSLCGDYSSVAVANGIADKREATPSSIQLVVARAAHNKRETYPESPLGLWVASKSSTTQATASGVLGGSRGHIQQRNLPTEETLDSVGDCGGVDELKNPMVSIAGFWTGIKAHGDDVGNGTRHTSNPS